jgi:23S rRNA pseudouridine2457 synthase
MTGRTLIFCKPYKVLSCFTDPEGRPTVGDYVKVSGVYAAGRLDYDSEGLLLLTSDGKLAHRITHPKYKLKKVYLVQVENIPDETALDQLRRGVLVKGKRTRPAEVELLSHEPELFPRSQPIRYRRTVPTAWLKITLREGRKRQARRMTAAVGHPTLRLIRIAIGSITLGDLTPGQWRDLSGDELKSLSRSLS